MEKISGVYQILNTVNGKRYIGSSVNITQRWNQHKKALEKNKHGNKHLQSAWNRYGCDCFVWSVLEKCEPSMVLEREQGYLPKEKTIGSLRQHGYYNAHPTVDSPKGLTQTKESNRKRGETLKGRVFSEEHKRKIGEANSRRVVTVETRRKITERNKERVVTDEERERLRTMNTGVKFTEEHRRKISEALKGRKITDTQKSKLSASKIGTKASEETKSKMSAAQKKRYAK